MTALSLSPVSGMLAPAAALSSAIMIAPSTGHGYEPVLAGQSPSRHFKKHKVLPRPQSGTFASSPPRQVKVYNTVPEPSAPGSPEPRMSRTRVAKHRPKEIETGPDLPPTPPFQSRSSSGSHLIAPPSPTTLDPRAQLTPKNTTQRPPETPPDQRSPPTPDVTPPQPSGRPKALRPLLSDRPTYRTATSESRTESFTTAREEPCSSEDEDSKSTIKPLASSARTSRTTIRQISDSSQGARRAPRPQDLGAALADLGQPPEEQYTPRTEGEFQKFDGSWGSRNDGERSADATPRQAPSVKRHQPVPTTITDEARSSSVAEDKVVQTSTAARAVRKMSLQDSPPIRYNPKQPLREPDMSSKPTKSSRAVTSGASSDAKRLSNASSQPSTSTVIEAFLVDGPPQRQRTLRHMRKQRVLREPVEHSSSSTAESESADSSARRGRPTVRHDHSRHESYASNNTTTSISSGRARRDVWKTGGIPVVVIPDRRSSSKSKSSQEPSLRSNSSRRSRTISINSVPVGMVNTGDQQPPSVERRARGRAYSESDGSDQRTIDYPPVIPARSSSLSAPTSRNGSRAASMTAESVRTHSTMQEALRHEQVVQGREAAPPVSVTHVTRQTREDSVNAGPSQEPKSLEPAVVLEPQLLATPASISPLERDFGHDRTGTDNTDDNHSSRRYTARNTPFSAASIDTNGTAPELSEAQAIHMYPHQNSSLLMINHSSKPSDGSETTARQIAVPANPVITRTGADGDVPVTPPQLHFSLEDVDSPLRNPRVPPDPPAHPPELNVIPATPSGLTPAQEKGRYMGNYFDVANEKPGPLPSLVRRALSRRRHSAHYPPVVSKGPGLLTRSLSLTRGTSTMSRSRSASKSRRHSDMEGGVTYPQAEDEPPESHKLHAFWRPRWLPDEDEDEPCSCPDCSEEAYRYPPVDNRPRPLKRSLSARMRQTFAVLPDRRDSYLASVDAEGPERRTVRRTPSGNLRVMRRRSSATTLQQRSRSNPERPYTAPGESQLRSIWRRHSLRKRSSRENMRRFSLGAPFEGIHDISRMISERRREKRSQELRQKISGPREVRDGVGEVIRPGGYSGHREFNGQI